MNPVVEIASNNTQLAETISMPKIVKSVDISQRLVKKTVNLKIPDSNFLIIIYFY